MVYCQHTCLDDAKGLFAFEYAILQFTEIFVSFLSIMAALICHSSNEIAKGLFCYYHYIHNDD
jgi:hypothetical protein